MAAGQNPNWQQAGRLDGAGNLADRWLNLQQARGRAGDLADKWSNWQAAVRVGRRGVNREMVHRLQRMAGVEDLAAEVASQQDVSSALAECAGHENEGVRASFQRYGRWSIDNFQSLKILGEGAFGIVHLVRHKETHELFALKQMEKSRFQRKNRQRAFIERDALSEARSRWSVELYATFQDPRNVYMVTEFLQGGDLVGLLQRRHRFTQEETSFYMGELVEALHTVHRCGFVHRDVKPDNVVISVEGHLKLLDFGLCKSDTDTAPGGGVGAGGGEEPLPQPMPLCLAPAARGRQRSVVGTPQYMAPESFTGKYSAASDLWAVGIIAFECLAGVVPFHSGRHQGPEAFLLIKEKIVRHATLFPEKLDKARRLGFTAPASETFMRGLICDRESRLSVEQLYRQPFFAGLDFKTLHVRQPPFVPPVSSPEDTSHFDHFPRPTLLPKAGPRLSWDRRLEWAHFELDGKAAEAQKPQGAGQQQPSVIRGQTV